MASWFVATAVLLTGNGVASATEPPAVDPSWLEYVAPLLDPAEIEAFESLERGFDRQAFVEAFWRSRDPDPATPRNELREEWPQLRGTAEARFHGIDNDRGRAFVLRGPPAFILDELCPQQLWPLEVWAYTDTAERIVATMIFYTPHDSDRPVQWDAETDSPAVLSPSSESEDAFRSLLAQCPRGPELAAALESAVGRAALAPKRADDWLEAFSLSRARTDLAPLACELDLHVVGSSGRRTIIDGTLTVSHREPVAASALKVRLEGTVYRGAREADSFRYLFEPPATGGSGSRTMAFRRRLPPGSYRLLLTVTELSSGRSSHIERPLVVPALTDSQAADGPDDGETHAPLKSLRIHPLPSTLLTGRQRIEVTSLDPAVAKVHFLLNDRPVMSKTKPPFSIEVDLGPAPRSHLVEAIALDAEGRELARDRLPVNVGPHRFMVRLLEPQQSQVYTDEVSVRAEVAVPPDGKLDRLEIFYNDTRLATLYQPPFVQPHLPLPLDDAVGYVRVVAVLSDGHSAEDLAVVNAPGSVDRVQVDYVELYATVVNRRGEPIDGLTLGDFSVLENDQPQPLRRLEAVRNLSISAAVAVDTSTSMSEKIDETQKAAKRFLSAVVRPQDRAAVIVFSDQPHLAVPLTNDVGKLAAGLSEIEAEGETTLYDAVVFGLYYLAGLPGKRALVLLSDGVDSESTHSFDETLEFARRSGTAIYAIGIGISPRDLEGQRVLRLLARETGGHSFFIDSARALDRVYEQIEHELRSQYLIGYQSTHSGPDFRRVEIEVAGPGLTARAAPGYYP